MTTGPWKKMDSGSRRGIRERWQPFAHSETPKVGTEEPLCGQTHDTLADAGTGVCR